MKRILLPAAVVVACTTPLLAQKTTEASAKSKAAVTYDALVTDYDAAVAAWREARNKVTKSEEYKNASDRDTRRELLSKVPPPDIASFRGRFTAEAEKYAGTDDAVDFLTWVAMYGGDREAQTEAADKLVEEHIKSAKLITLAENARYLFRPLGQEGYEELCGKIADGSPHNMVRAWALYCRGSMMKRGRNVPEETVEQADAILAEAETLAEGTLLADMIAGPRFEKERLQIGMQVPDIEGEDIDGVKFKLSDYRGKVVVLDFWGDW